MATCAAHGLLIIILDKRVIEVVRSCNMKNCAIVIGQVLKTLRSCNAPSKSTSDLLL